MIKFILSCEYMIALFFSYNLYIAANQKLQ